MDNSMENKNPQLDPLSNLQNVSEAPKASDSHLNPEQFNDADSKTPPSEPPKVIEEEIDHKTGLPPVTKVLIPHEHYIPVSKYKLSKRLALLHNDKNERYQFEQLCRIISAIYHFEYHKVQEELSKGYRIFDPLIGSEERQGMTEEEIWAAEDEFLTDFLLMMERGNFLPLTQEDYDVADEEDFLFNLPVKISLDKLDHEMIPRYFHKNPERLQRYFDGNLPKFAESILIFRRGVGREKFTGFLTIQKIDVLVSRVLTWIWNKTFGRLFSKPEPESHGPTAQEKIQAKNTEKNHIHEDRYEERITPTHITRGLFCLLRRDTIKEPTFKNLIILFRYATPKTGRNEPPPKELGIHIKQFRDIPMADLEVIYPEKHLSMKPLDLVKLGITLVSGIVIAGWKLVFSAVLSPILLIVALSTIVGYGMKVFFGWQNSKNRYEQLVTNSLYHKSLDNDLGVIFYLMDSLENQEFKEAILAYYFLWRQGPATEAELDQKCEKFIHDAFDVEVDFEVDDALHKLEKEQLVTKDENGKYTAIPIVAALEKLDEKWDNYFTWNNEKQKKENEVSSAAKELFS